MAVQNRPNIGVALVAIHHVITRGLSVTMDNSAHFAQAGFPDDSTADGFANYVRSLATVVHAHHSTETDLAFPRFQDLVPDAPYDLLNSEHRSMESVLQDIETAVAESEPGKQPVIALDELSNAVTRLDRMWHPHIQIEEHQFSPDVLERLLGPEGHKRWLKEFVEHTQQLSPPDELVVPFMLYNLAADERWVMSDGMPPIVLEQLVPVVWKEKWAPMQPFLLA
jgi:hemerythrin-like domain-containing protein